MKYFLSIHKPRRPDPDISFAEELELRDELGMGPRCIYWDKDHLDLSPNEIARRILNREWEIERGWVVNNLTTEYNWATMKAYLYWGLDWVFGIKSPYQ